jgi:DNA-binding response OmpR family regulator
VLVEDDTGMRSALEELLRVAGFDVVSFASGEELLRSEARPDCLILDIQLPGLSGFDLCERFRTRPGEPPVVFITAHDTEKSRERALDLGAAYLAKPFSGQRFLEAVRQATTRRARES